MKGLFGMKRVNGFAIIDTLMGLTLTAMVVSTGYLVMTNSVKVNKATMVITNQVSSYSAFKLRWSEDFQEAHHIFKSDQGVLLQMQDGSSVQYIISENDTIVRSTEKEEVKLPFVANGLRVKRLSEGDLVHRIAFEFSAKGVSYSLKSTKQYSAQQRLSHDQNQENNLNQYN